MYNNLLKDIDTARLKWDKERTINIIKWVIESFNRDFSKKKDSFSDINAMKKAYIEEIKEYVEIIKGGIYK